MTIRIPLLRSCGLLTVALIALAGTWACSQEPVLQVATTMAGEAAHSAAAEQLWTCGMHPNVIESEPGPCPICGMDLTPVIRGGPPPSSAAGHEGGARKVAYWVAPMDPTFVSDAPGKSPMGMDLVPVYEDEIADDGGVTVSIDPVVVQNMGVRIGQVKREPLFRHLRTVGEVETAEDLVSVVNLRFSGWVVAIHVDTTGELVERGDPLFEIYSPELVAAQDEYLLALRAQGTDASLTRSARRKLDLLGLDPRELRDIERTGHAKRAVPIRAPRAGYVLHKSVVEGARVMAGQDLYTVADLSSVWVKAEIYEHDAPWLEEGQPARMDLSYQRGVQVEGSVAYVYPTLDAASRTLTVRLEFPNPDLRFKPGMFATVYIEFRRVDDAIVVPTEAVLHSGTRELVFVVVGEGRFEAREITTGLVGDRRLTQVISGLEPGDRVVTSGQFLIDSESQLQEAIAKLIARRSGRADTEPAVSRNDEIHACPMHPDQIAAEEGRCEVCGMDLELRSATPEELARLDVRPRGTTGSSGAVEGAAPHAGHEVPDGRAPRTGHDTSERPR